MESCRVRGGSKPGKYRVGLHLRSTRDDLERRSSRDPASAGTMDRHELDVLALEQPAVSQKKIAVSCDAGQVDRLA